MAIRCRLVLIMILLLIRNCNCTMSALSIPLGHAWLPCPHIPSLLPRRSCSQGASKLFLVRTTVASLFLFLLFLLVRHFGGNMCVDFMVLDFLCLGCIYSFLAPVRLLSTGWGSPSVPPLVPAFRAAMQNFKHKGPPLFQGNSVFSLNQQVGAYGRYSYICSHNSHASI